MASVSSLSGSFGAFSTFSMISRERKIKSWHGNLDQRAMEVWIYREKVWDFMGI